MPTTLHVNASPRYAHSHSLRLARHFIDSVQAAGAESFDLAAADAYVFNIPMWNAGVPYVLKQWIDIITQPGWSFGFDPEMGYRGLMEGKQALAVHTSGVYAPGVPAAFGSDFSSTFFADWLNFVGIEDAVHVRFAPTVLNGDVDGTRKLAEAELSDAAPGFADKLSSVGTLQLVNG